jgi:hypothetical protein
MCFLKAPMTRDHLTAAGPIGRTAVMLVDQSRERLRERLRERDRLRLLCDTTPWIGLFETIMVINSPS